MHATKEKTPDAAKAEDMKRVCHDAFSGKQHARTEFLLITYSVMRDMDRDAHWFVESEDSPAWLDDSQLAIWLFTKMGPLLPDFVHRLEKRVDLMTKHYASPGDCKSDERRLALMHASLFVQLADEWIEK